MSSHGFRHWRFFKNLMPMLYCLPDPPWTFAMQGMCWSIDYQKQCTFSLSRYHSPQHTRKQIIWLVSHVAFEKLQGKERNYRTL